MSSVLRTDNAPRLRDGYARSGRADTRGHRRHGGREGAAGRVLREPSAGQGPAPGSRGLRDRAAVGALLGPTGDADAQGYEEIEARTASAYEHWTVLLFSTSSSRRSTVSGSLRAVGRAPDGPDPVVSRSAWRASAGRRADRTPVDPCLSPCDRVRPQRRRALSRNLPATEHEWLSGWANDATSCNAATLCLNRDG